MRNMESENPETLPEAHWIKNEHGLKKKHGIIIKIRMPYVTRTKPWPKEILIFKQSSL